MKRCETLHAIGGRSQAEATDYANSRQRWMISRIRDAHPAGHAILVDRAVTGESTNSHGGERVSEVRTTILYPGPGANGVTMVVSWAALTKYSSRRQPGASCTKPRWLVTALS